MSTMDPDVSANEPSSHARQAPDTGWPHSERSGQTVLFSYRRNRALLVDASTGKRRWEIQTDQDIRAMVHGGEVVYLACGASRGEQAVSPVPRPTHVQTQQTRQTPDRGVVWVAGKGLSEPVPVELDRVSADPARPHGFLYYTSPRAEIVVEIRFVAAQVEARRARDGTLLWRFGGPELVGTAQLCLHEGTLAVLSPFGSIPSHDASLYGLDARTGAPRWTRDYRAEGLRLRTPPRQARSQAGDQTWPGVPAPDAASTIARTDSTDTIGPSERTEPWRTDDWRPQHHPQALPPEPATSTPVEHLARASLTVLGAGGGLLFLHVRLLGQSEQGRDGGWALERLEAVDAVTGTTRWTVTTPHGCESAVSPAGRIVALWRRHATRAEDPRPDACLPAGWRIGPAAGPVPPGSRPQGGSGGSGGGGEAPASRAAGGDACPNRRGVSRGDRRRGRLPRARSPCIART